MAESETFVGIDFGTTNSAIAVGSGDVQLASFEGIEGGRTDTFRSVLFFDPEHKDTRGRAQAYIGNQGIAAYLEAGGEGRLLQSFKSHLASRQFTSTNIFNRVYRLEELVAIVLRGLATSAAAQFGALPPRVVIGRPVRFVHAESDEDDTYATTRLREAAALAGFTDVELVYEPVGAAYYYESTLRRDELVLIADFGGGTSDFCLLHLGPGARGAGRERTILGTEGVALAGDAFDHRIIEAVVAPRLGRGSMYRSYMEQRLLEVPSWIYSRLSRWHQLSFLKSRDTMKFLEELHAQSLEPEKIEALIHVVDQDLGYHLYRAVERTKVELSSRAESRFEFSAWPLQMEATVTRSDFERWIAPELAAIGDAVDRLLARTHTAPEKVDRVFTTGGSSFVPAVQKIFADRFGRERMRGGNELTSIALGLAMWARDR